MPTCENASHLVNEESYASLDTCAGIFKAAGGCRAGLPKAVHRLLTTTRVWSANAMLLSDGESYASLDNTREFTGAQAGPAAADSML